jgi:hypothetical protein
MAYFGTLNKLTMLKKANMENSTFCVNIGTVMTGGFKVRTRKQQLDGLARSLFNIALEYVMRQL